MFTRSIRGANHLSAEFSRYSFNLSGVYQFYSLIILNTLRNAKFMRSGRKGFMDSRYFSKLINSHLGILLEYFNAANIDHIEEAVSVNSYFRPTKMTLTHTHVLLIQANSPRKQVSETFYSSFFSVCGSLRAFPSFCQLQPRACAASLNVCFLFKISVRIITFLGLDSASFLIIVRSQPTPTFPSFLW